MINMIATYSREGEEGGADDGNGRSASYGKFATTTSTQLSITCAHKALIHHHHWH